MIYNIKSPNEMATWNIVYDGSTMLERPGLRGASHLLEHLMCKEFDVLQDDLQQHGINWNAYTSTHEIVFWFCGLEQELAAYRLRLLALLANFNATQEQFDNEKKIVLQEYKDTFTDQYWTHHHNLMRHRFGQYDPIGLKADLEALTLEDLQHMFAIWYTRPTKIINVSPRFNHYDSRKLGNNQVTASILQDYPSHQQTYETASVHEGTSCVRVQTAPIQQHIPHLKIISNMLSTGLNSPLTRLIREKHGLCYGFWATTMRYNREALFTLSGTTADENVDQLVDLALEFLNHVTEHLTKERLDIVRRELQITDKCEAMERYRNVQPWMTPPEFQVREIQDTVTLEELLAVAEEHLHPDKMLVSVDKRNFPPGK